MNIMDDPIIEKRALYSVSYFKSLLRDATFVSYFNVHLNLPIFPRRITYIPSTRSFNIEPPLMRKYLQTNSASMFRWLSAERLPMFTCSHLFLHYELCKTLTLNNPIAKSFSLLGIQIEEVSEFYNFHHYMLEGEGNSVISAWLHIQKLHTLSNEEKATSLENLFDTYLVVDSPYVLAGHYRESVQQQLSGICTGVRFVKRDIRGASAFLQQFKDKLLREKRLLRPLQANLTEDMRSYWLPRYYTHLSNRMGETAGEKEGSSGSLVKLLELSSDLLLNTDDIETVANLVKENLCSSDGLRRTSQVVFSPLVGMDVPIEECANKKKESMAERTLLKFVSRNQDERLRNRRTASMHESGGPRRRSVAVVSGANRQTFSNNKNRHSVSDSFGLTTSRNNSFDSVKEIMVKRLHNGRRPSGLGHFKPSKSVAWSRHKWSRPRPTLQEQYLEGELELFRCSPCPLRDEIYKDNYCDALHQIYNESSLREVDINHLLEVSIASDSIGGEDFKSFLRSKKNQTSLYNYEFWVEIEGFSNKYSSDSSMSFCARGRAMNITGFFSEQNKVSFDWVFEKNQMVSKIGDICNLEKDLHSLLYKYTHPDGARYTNWDDPFTDSLWFAIVNNHSVQEWLTLAQKFSSKILMPDWLHYIEDRENKFLQSCTALRRGNLTPTFLRHTSEDLIYETMCSPNCHIMWAALQLAEAIEYPGANLPEIGHLRGHRNLSPDFKTTRSAATPSQLNSRLYSPTKLFSDSQPPNRRDLLPGAQPPEIAPVPGLVVASPVDDMEKKGEVTETKCRREDAIKSSLTQTDSALSQLEYNLSNTAGLDLSLERISTFPRNFSDVLRYRELLGKFRQFLKFNDDNQDTSVLLYQIVEGLKTCKNPKQRQDRMQFIHSKFFGPLSTLRSKIMIDKNCSVYRELSCSKKVSHSILVSAQTLVIKEMESVYWLPFIEAFPDHIREKIISMNSKSTTAEGSKVCGNTKNRRLWSNFTVTVINFKNGIMDPEVCSHFRQFLSQYVSDVSAKCTKNTQKRQVVNNKIIDIEKIQADLDFFIEVEKYKEIFESVQKSAQEGNYNPTEEEMLTRKGRVLIHCYIDSLLPPKVQINITHDKVAEIRKLHENCIFERGMFHDAALSLFPSLTYFWKKFCLQRHSPSSIKVIQSDQLILKERVGRDLLHRNTGVPQTATDRNAVIHLPHLAQGLLHLLNRYTESKGLIQMVAQNTTHAHDTRRGVNFGNSTRSPASSKMSGVGSPGSATPLATDNPGLGGSVIPGNKRLNVLGNYSERRSSIMSPGRLQRGAS